MPPVDLEGLRETFEAIDKSHSGTISLEELTIHLQVIFFFECMTGPPDHFQYSRTILEL